MVRTECEACGAKFSNPSRAIEHSQKRGKGHFTRLTKTENNGADPRSTPILGPVFGGTFPIPDELVCSPSCSDRGVYWEATLCQCNCHYQGPTARKMIKGAHADDD